MHSAAASVARAGFIPIKVEMVHQVVAVVLMLADRVLRATKATAARGWPLLLVVVAVRGSGKMVTTASSTRFRIPISHTAGMAAME